MLCNRQNIWCIPFPITFFHKFSSFSWIQKKFAIYKPIFETNVSDVLDKCRIKVAIFGNFPIFTSFGCIIPHRITVHRLTYYRNQYSSKYLNWYFHISICSFSPSRCILVSQWLSWYAMFMLILICITQANWLAFFH